MEKISIIIPVYNAEKYINNCIKSIINQTYRNWKLIIVDDGSTDKTSEIINEYLKINENIFLFSKKNGGSASARNYALNLIDTNYFVFIDADDTVHPQYLELMYETIKKYNADIVQCNFRTVNNNNNLIYVDQIITEVNEYTGEDFLEKFCRKSSYLRTAVLWNKMYKTALFTNLLFPEGKGIDDEFLICQVLIRAKKIVEIPNTLYDYFLSPNSQMRSKPTLKSIDNVEAIEGQLNLFKTNNLTKLYNLLLYRYYSSVAGAYRFLKSNYPDEKELLLTMDKKRRKWKEALYVKEISIIDKVLLIIRVNFPSIFYIIHGVLK